MNEQHATGKPEIGAPAMSINDPSLPSIETRAAVLHDDHGAAAPGGDAPASDRATVAANLMGWLTQLQTTDDTMLQFFEFDHLPEHLQNVSMHFAALAITICRELPKIEERRVALRKLLEAKDAAVRSRITR